MEIHVINKIKRMMTLVLLKYFLDACIIIFELCMEKHMPMPYQNISVYSV